MGTTAKVFIVLNLVISLVFAISAFCLFAKQVNWVEQTRLAIEESNAYHKQATKDIADLTRERDSLKEKSTNFEKELAVTQETLKSSQKSCNEAIDKFNMADASAKRNETRVKDLEAQIEVKDKRNSDLQGRLDGEITKLKAASKEKDWHQARAIETAAELVEAENEMMQLAKNNAEMVRRITLLSTQLEKYVSRYGADPEISANTSGVSINGKVLQVEPKLDLVILSVGGKDKVQRGMEFVISRGNNYIIYTLQETYLIDMYAPPSAEHWMGTDDHGMDMLTRLMYGGRISLMVGFIVMLLENFLGIIVGGVSGYFGGWVDTLLMRFVDLFNSIPYYPMMIIAGAIMDAFEVPPYTRIFLLMAIMGIMGWTGVARVVRGQILSLREQDFMVATEATGIRVRRRIFRHLVPNVMPLLIVQATMGLGGIILTEATLSFLGLGIKYPLASWGSIINAASNIYVMTNFWYIWIPAGVLIVLTVLGFNFVGDGLRDAFDPKMKR